MTREDVLRYVRERFDTVPDAPFADSPDSLVLRHAGGGRWYGMLAIVGRSRLGLMGDGMANILNVKCDPLIVDALCTQPGFVRAWHMNKTHWLTILLDDVADVEQVEWLISESHRLTGAARTNKKKVTIGQKDDSPNM